MNHSKKALAVTAISLVLSSPPSHAFEPLTTLAVSLGTSLVVKGFNFLVDKAIQPPDVHFEETKAMHRELRAVHQAVLENRSLQIEIHDRTKEQIDAVIREMLDMEGRIKTGVAMAFEQERIVDLLAYVQPIYDTLAPLESASPDERKRLEEVLHEQFIDLQPRIEKLTYIEKLRSGAVLPRLAAVRGGWSALAEIPDIPGLRASFAVKQGRWLTAQRQRTGSRDPVDQTLADLIYDVEQRSRSIDRYFAALANECSVAWSGLISVDEYVRHGDTIEVKKVRITKVQRQPAPLERAQVDALDELRPLNIALISPSEVQFSQEVIDVRPSIRLRLDRRSFGSVVRELSQRIFECKSAFRPAHAMNFVPEATWYDNLSSWEILDAPPCGESCRRYWEYIHMVREIAAGTLTGMYFVRQELNRTLEWLAYETTGAGCTYLQGEPRVCVFDGTTEYARDPGIVKSAQHVSEKERPDLRAAYKLVRSIRDRISEEAVDSAHQRINRGRLEHRETVRQMTRDLNESVSHWQEIMASNDDRLVEAQREATRMAYMRFFWSIVEDQVNSFIATKVEAFLSDALIDRKVGGEDANGWSVAIVEDQQPSEGNTPERGPLLMSMIATTPTRTRSMDELDGSSQDADQGHPTHLGQGFTSNIDQSAYSYSANALSYPQKLALWLPEVPKGGKEFIAGLGESVSFGLVQRVNEWLGVAAEIDRESGAYTSGSIVGILNVSGIGGSSVFQALRAGRAGATLAKLGEPPYVSLLLRITSKRTSTISLVKHRGFAKGRIAALDIDPLGKGRLATRLPHIHVPRIRAHLPWEPPWVMPVFLGIYTPTLEE